MNETRELLTCRYCRAPKPLDAFYPSVRTQPTPGCRDCCAERRRSRLANCSPEEREALRERHRQANRRHLERGGRIKNAHGITLEQFEGMHAAQGGVCAICQRPPSGNGNTGSRLHIDHDHDTGQIRGLLCGNCSTALGLLADNPERIHRMIEYLLAARGGG